MDTPNIPAAGFSRFTPGRAMVPIASASVSNPSHWRDAQFGDWSPDGKHPLWSSERSGNLEVWMANADGFSPRQITKDGFSGENPTMSRDEQWIVYSSAPQARRHLENQTGRHGRSAIGRWSYFGQRGSFARWKVCRLIDNTIQASVFRETSVLIGRVRSMPDDKTVLFVGQNSAGVKGLYMQDFVPGQDTASTRRQVGPFDPENSVESFGISPDGQFVKRPESNSSAS
jgi:hypothetical protein